MYKLLALIKNTFTETLRQPIYAILILAALLLFTILPSLTMYTMGDDNKLLREIGLSTLLLTSLFISIFSASGALADEIENKTVITVLSKPIRRPVFVIAKFLGVAGAVALAHYICTIALLMSIRHGVLDAGWKHHDWTVIVAAGGTVLLSLGLSAFLNYVYDWRFSSTAVVLAAVFGTLSMILLSFIDPEWKFNPAGNNINAFDIYASALLLCAAVIMVSLAMAVSARFNIVVTLSACIGMFLLGLISDYVFGQLAATHIWAKIGRFIVPNLQVFWISDAIYEGSPVPITYVLMGGTYALCYTTAILFIAIALFQRRQVG
ncbi:ABC-2 transporter permease [Planctomycetota bacterium]